MAWVALLVASVFEIGFSVSLKYTSGLSRPWPLAAMVVCMGVSLVFLSAATRTLPLGTAYAVWTGIGIIGTAAAGAVLFREPLDPARLACLAMIAGGVVGLKVVGG